MLPAAVNAQTHHDLRTGREAAFLAIGVSLHAAAIVHRAGSTHRPWPPDPATLPAPPGALRHRSLGCHRASNVLFASAAVGSLALGVWNQHGEAIGAPPAITLECLLITSGLTNLVKEVTARPRPYAYDPELPEAVRRAKDAHRSFWSGHTANSAALTFSTAMLVQRSTADAGLKRGTWIAAAALPAAVGVLRVRAGRHFPRDVLTGFAAGALMGIAAPYFHRTDPGTAPQ